MSMPYRSSDRRGTQRARTHSHALSLSLGLMTTLSLTAAAPAPAAEPAGQAQGRVIEEILVTGTKREAAAQDIPIAVTAISDEMLQRQFRNDILAINEMTPGVAIGQLAGFRAIAGGVRGTGQNSILVTQDSSVVLLVDEFALSNVQSQFVELFDVDRIEVFRGPQGTLFGKSATGGAINIITKRPVMDEYGADFRVQYGSFDGDDGPDSDITKYNVALNVPLIPDQLAVRAVAIWDEDDGYYSNDKATATWPDFAPLFGGPAPVPPGVSTRTVGSGENINNTDVFAGKVKVLWQPNDNYEAYFLYDYLDDNSGSVPGVNESEPDMLLPLLGFPGVAQSGLDDILSTGITNQCVEGNADGLCVSAGHRVDVKSYMLHQTLEVSDYSAKLIIGRREMEEILPSTYTGEAFTSLFDSTRNTTRNQNQYELRVTSNYTGPFNFVAGASYAEEETDMLAFATVGLTSLLPPFDTDILFDPTTTGARQDRETLAFYLDGSYELTERLSFTAGVRFTDDEKDFFRRANPGGPCTAETPAKDQVIVAGECLDARSNAISRVGGDFSAKDLDAFTIPLPDSAYQIAAGFNDSWDEITYRFVVDYDVTDASMVYLSYATGFIPGGFTETCSSLATCQPFDSETNSNIEAGFKGQFAEGRVQTNVALFYTEYEDLIRSQVIPFTNAFGVTTQETININAGVSEAWGVETELTWLATPNLQIMANVGYLDHEYDEFELDVPPIDGVLEDLSDLDVPFSPEWKWGISATYDQMLPVGGLTYNVNVNHQDEAQTSVFNSPFTQMSERTLWDANITYRGPEDRYYVTLWGKNLTDERYRIGANSVAGLWNFTMYGRPRSYGLEVGVTL
jgi:iron complex outermembrane receptor protein